MSDQLCIARYRNAIEALAEGIAQLDSATAYAVVAEAREMVRTAWLRRQIQLGEDSGEPVDGPAAMQRLLRRADQRLRQPYS